MGCIVLEELKYKLAELVSIIIVLNTKKEPPDWKLADVAPVA